MISSSRSRPTNTLPKRSARLAWNSAKSGRIALSTTIGSPGANGLSITFQSSRLAQQVGVEKAAQRDEREPFLSRLQRRVDRRAGRIDHPQAAFLAAPRRSAARCRTRPSVTAGGLERAHAAGADQHVGLDSADRHAQQMQVAHAAPDQLARGRHGDAGRILGNGEQRAVRDGSGERLEAADAALRDCGVWCPAWLVLQVCGAIILRSRSGSRPRRGRSGGSIDRAYHG